MPRAAKKFCTALTFRCEGSNIAAATCKSVTGIYDPNYAACSLSVPWAKNRLWVLYQAHVQFQLFTTVLNWLWDTFLHKVCIFNNLWRVVKIGAFSYLSYVYEPWKFRTNTSKGFCGTKSQSGRNFENLFYLPKNVWERGLNGRVGSTTEIRCVHDAPLYFAPSIFREIFFLKTSKIGPFSEGA